MNHFFDVGAHTGNTFPYLGAMHYEWNIYCFEPSQRHIPILIDAAKGLKHLYKNIYVCPFGLGEFTKPQVFYPKTIPEGDSFFEGYEVNENLGYNLVSMTYSAADFILTFTKPEDKIHMKLDCEGSEYGIIKSLMRNPDAFNRIEKLFVEWHRVPGFDDEVRVEMARECDSLGHPVHDWGH